MLATPAVVIGQQHQLLPIRLQTANTLQEPLQFFGHLPARQWIRGIGSHFHGRRLLFDRDFGAFAHDVNGTVSGDRGHPRDRRRQAGVELSRAVPDLDVSLLNDLLRKVLSTQDTEHHAKEFRARGDVKALKSGLIPLRNGGNQPDQLSWRQHSNPQKIAMPHRFVHTAAAVQTSPTIPCPKPVHQASEAPGWRCVTR